MRNFQTRSILLVAAAAYLMAADPVWKDKPAASGPKRTPSRSSPGPLGQSKSAAVVTRRLTEDQLREGGQMGQPRGIGNEGVDPKGSGPKVRRMSSRAPAARTAAFDLFPSPYFETALGERSSRFGSRS